MTERGTFIINGIPKVIVNQIIKSPGVFFNKSFNKKKEPINTAIIISDRGLWLNIKYEIKTDYIWAEFGKDKKRVPIMTLLQAIGLTQKKIFFSIQNRKNIKEALQLVSNKDNMPLSNHISTLDALNGLKEITEVESIVHFKIF